MRKEQEGETYAVKGYYTSYLHRTADTNGLNTQVNALTSGQDTREQVQANLLSGNEYFDLYGSTNEGYVNHVYLDVLGRSADSAGLTTQLNYLRQGGG